MANQYGRPMEGERHTPKYPRDYPALPSGLLPLPYYPNLKRELRSVTGALVLTYLEIYYPPSQDASGALLRAPVTLHLDQISEDLQISRRTLFTALCVLAARWGSEEARARAARAGREFLNPAHTINGKVKLYSVTGAIGYIPHTIVQLHRNFSLISCHASKRRNHFAPATRVIGIDRFKTLDASAISAPTAHILAQKESLSEILLRSSVLAGDRRRHVIRGCVRRWGMACCRRVHSRSAEMRRKLVGQCGAGISREVVELSGCSFTHSSGELFRNGSRDWPIR